jgi:ABC-type nitrate/sulfonate/bicarbonate transport system substrate-binding protein
MKKLWLSIAAVCVVVGAGGASTASPAHQLAHINYATSFGNFGRDAYVYVAIAKGYFKAAGFDVSVAAGNGSEDDMKLIAAGKIDYAPVDFRTSWEPCSTCWVPGRTSSPARASGSTAAEPSRRPLEA